MRRRIGLGLLAALVLFAPVATPALAPHDASPDHQTARISPVDHHSIVAHAVAPNRVRARRGAHHRRATASVLATSSLGVAATPTRAIVAGSGDASPTGLPSTSRPRAPPAAA